MKESYGEGCSDPHRPRVMRSRSRGRRRSVDRGTCGPGIEPRKNFLRSADAVRRSGRPHRRIDIARRGGTPRGQRPRARTETPRAGTGRSLCSPAADGARAVSGSPKAYDDDERAQEVGQTRSTGKPPNKAGRPAAEGVEGRGLAKGNPRRAKRAPDSEPDQRAQCARAGTSGSKRRTGRCSSRRCCTMSTT